MKKILTFLLALLMLASVCVIGANAQSYCPLTGWKDGHDSAEEAKIEVKKADPADVKKDGVIGDGEYERLVVDQTEDNTPLHVLYVTNDNLQDGLDMLATIEFWFSWDEVHGFNFAIVGHPAVIKQVLDVKDDPEKPGDDFANNTAFILNMLTENGLAGTIDENGWAHGSMDPKNYCVYYALAKRTDTGAYIEGHYDSNQLGLTGDYDPEGDTDYIITYTDDTATIEWSVPFSYIESGEVGAGSSIFACLAMTTGNAGPEDDMYSDTYGIGLGDKCLMVDAKVDKAGAFAEFVLSDEEIKPEPPAIVFDDVPADEYYAAPVNWAVAKGITTGTSSTTFSPNDPCTRGQVVTFLWRAAGSPKPASSTNPFTDVKAGEYYYDAVLWAVEKGVTTGTSKTTFSPDDPCTRGQIVTFICRYAGGSDPGATNPFGDVKADDYFYVPVMWAVANKITTGTTPTTFGPEETCTRAQVVTFLYRYAG